MNFDLASRSALVSQTYNVLEAYYSNTKAQKVAADWDIKEVKAYAKKLQLAKPNEINAVLEHLMKGLSDYAVHTPHPNYFGLFNPRSNFASILADLITATFNPQLAAWSHAPFANEIERYVIEAFGKRIGFEDTVDGTFCTGGAEANLSALICALNHAFPNFNESGVRGLKAPVVIYCSSESHHSIEKAAKITGLGTHSVHFVPVKANLQMDIVALKHQIAQDLKKGLIPLMIVGTAGTTGVGAIDDLRSLHAIAREHNSWFHVDAAYGGAIAISQKYKSIVAGIELSDSLTIDLHKWFSVPMGASLLLTSNKKVLHQSFAVKTTYMPEDGDVNQIIDPYVHSVQWSRRFIGLKIYLPLAIHGWEGYEQTINQQLETGQQLKEMLLSKGWRVYNDSPLPIICFAGPADQRNKMLTIVAKINATGKAWLSTYPIGGIDTARVCITNYLTGEPELKDFLDLLEIHRVSPISKTPAD